MRAGLSAHARTPSAMRENSERAGSSPLPSRLGRTRSRRVSATATPGTDVSGSTANTSLLSAAPAMAPASSGPAMTAANVATLASEFTRTSVGSSAVR